MTSNRRAGRIIGVLMLVKTPIAPVVNFALLGPAFAAPAGFLAGAAAHSTQVTAAVLLMLVMSAISLGIAITAWPVFRRYGEAMALWLLAITLIGIAGVLVEGFALQSMLALSRESVNAGAADAGRFQALGAWAESTRYSAHFTNFVISGAGSMVFYAALFRFALVPRVLSALGVVTSVLLIAGGLIPLLGYPTVMLLFVPIGLVGLALMVWLLVRGFAEGRPADV
jgi:Domain of unknown function (DUF4386)